MEMYSSNWGSATFWIFLAIVVASGYWRDMVGRREAQKTLRLAIEKNYTLDQATLDKILATKDRKSPGSKYGSGIFFIALGLGLATLGVFVRMGGDDGALYPMFGVGALFGFIGLGSIVAARLSSDEPPSKL